MTYFVTASPFDEITHDNKQFEFWIFIECCSMFGIVLSNILFLIIRSFERMKISFEFDGDSFDHHSDYLSS